MLCKGRYMPGTDVAVQFIVTHKVTVSVRGKAVGIWQT